MANILENIGKFLAGGRIKSITNILTNKKNWREVIESSDWKDADFVDKLFVKNSYWENKIAKSFVFRTADTKRRLRIKDSFFVDRPEEGLPSDFMGIMKEGIKKPLANKALIRAFQIGNRGVEEVAKVIEPEVPAGRTTAGLIVKDFPRQIAADFIRFYKPKNVVAAYALGKLIKPIAKPVGRFISKHTSERVKQFMLKEFTVSRGAPKEFVELARIAELETLAGSREAAQVAKSLSIAPKNIKGITVAGEKFLTRKGKILPQDYQRYIGKIFRKEVNVGERLSVHPLFKELNSIAQEGRTVMDKWSTELIKSGIPKAEAERTINKNLGKYMARMYTKKLASRPPIPGLGIKNLRLRLKGLKHRKNLTAEVRQQLGEIKGPALPTAIRVKEISESVANEKLFKATAANPEWVAKSNLTGNMIQMSNNTTMGSLRGKWVVPEIANDINAILVARNQAQSAYMKAISAWKFGKVVLNPATHSRNIMSNSMLLDLSGTNHIRQLALFPKAMKEYIKKGPIYQQALKEGAIGGEFVGSEIARIRDYYVTGRGGNFQKWMRVLKMPFAKAAQAYQGEEQLAKMVKFMDVLNKGGTAKIAAQEAQKWLFNYTKVPGAIEVAKKVAPFITFTYKALPRVAEAMTESPLRVYKYFALFKSWNSAASKTLDMTPDEFARQTKNLPPWLARSIGGMPTNLLMPWKDEHDRTQWLNLEYILPLGMAPEITQKGVLKGFVSNPVLTLFADLVKNKDFTGKDIIPIASTRAEATQKVIEHTYRQLAPSLAPALPGIKGGYSFEKLMSAVQKRPDFMGRVRAVPAVVFDTLMGLKLNSLDVDEAEMFRMFDKKSMIEDLTKQAFKLQHPAISDEEQEKGLEKIFEKIQRVLEE